MKEYGGYIELESFKGNLFHDNAIPLNCGRNALAYICEAKNIKKLYIPYFLCSSIKNTCEKINVEYDCYYINGDFKPIIDFDINNNEYIYIVNYYGQLDNSYINELKREYKNIIVDNAQSYFQMPIHDVDTLYTCRKYFGVSDGAFLYTDKFLDYELEIDESLNRMQFILGRFERSANEFYSKYVENNSLFKNESIKQMSKLTENLLRGEDYEYVGLRRQLNFECLDLELNDINELNVKCTFGPYMYPLYVSNGDIIRKYLQSKKIYIPVLWPNVLDDCDENTIEYQYALNILPIPVDQRYGIDDMRYLIGEIKKAISIIE